MDILFIIDPIETLDLETDTSFCIMKEAYAREHTVWITETSDLRMENNIPYGTVTKLHIQKQGKTLWKKGDRADASLEAMPVIFMRKNPPYTIDYITANLILSFVNPKKTFIINNPSALRNFNEKLGILHFTKIIPKTLVSKKYSAIGKFLRRHKKIVLKPIDGFSGHEVFVIEEKDKNKNAIIEMLTKRQHRYIMAQQYIQEVSKGDKRILVLNGKILGAENRIAPPEDHRSNIATGGTSHKTALTPKERKIAEDVGAYLKNQEIYFAGIDMIGGLVSEINITSPAGIVEINGHEGKHLEKKVVDFIENYA